jgi:hypothetical protein
MRHCVKVLDTNHTDCGRSKVTFSNHLTSEQSKLKLRPSHLQISLDTISPKDKALPPLPLNIKRNNATKGYKQSVDVSLDAHKSIESHMRILHKIIESFDPTISVPPEFAGLYGSPATKLTTFITPYDPLQASTSLLEASHNEHTLSFLGNIQDSVQLKQDSLKAGGNVSTYKNKPYMETNTEFFKDSHTTFNVVKAHRRRKIQKENIPPPAFMDVNPPPYNQNEGTHSREEACGYSFF